jgi:LysM repeat protein
MMTARLQRSCSCGKGNDVPPIVHAVLRSPGRPLDRSTRDFFEPRFGHDFTRVAATQAPQKLSIGEAHDAYEHEADRFASLIDRSPAMGRADLGSVRLHNDSRAAESARAVGARAYTVGSHIVFGAGELASHTDSGRRLLAHELAHVGQQNEGRVARSLQRSLTVIDPATAAPNQPAGQAAGAKALTNAEVAQGWINSACASGGWTIDPTSGVLATANRAAFCDVPKPPAATSGKQPANPPAAPPPPGYTTSGTPVSCKCLCDITASGSPTVRLHTGDTMVAPGPKKGTSDSVDVKKAGQGATLHPQGTRTETHVGISGREGTGVTGAGATNPPSGTGRNQTLQDPPWLIFTHEVCGHVLTTAQTSSYYTGGHSQSPAGTDSAVDVENRIRREHSTTASSLGIRVGDARVEDAKDSSMTVVARGAHYTVASGDTLASLATRFGIAANQITDNIFLGEGGRFKTAKDPITDTVLFIRNLSYHQVIAGETAASIATFWGVPEASLRRANPSLGPAGQPTVGTRLFIPAS